jgi:hypothetical protein
MYQIQNSNKQNIGACMPCRNLGEETAPLLTPGMTPYYSLPVTKDLTQTVSGLTLLLLGAVGMIIIMQIAYKR